MKKHMYVFEPNDWGMRFFVMAEDKVDAHASLLDHFRDRIKELDKQNYGFETSAKRDLDIWKKVKPLDATTFPDNYTLNEFEEGVVVESELS